MRFIADLHVHSRFSRATSQNATLESYFQWARVKGIHVIGTGDFTHPGYFQEIQEKLEPDESGLLRLKNPPHDSPILGIHCENIPVRFCLQTEISSIYKKGDKTRKVHSLVFAPNVTVAQRINARLAALGNIASDGRPILGVGPKDILEVVRDTSPDAYLIPAHVWTPWFSVFGSRSGFDCLQECFDDLSDEVFALETGLSSDPQMNWRWSALDRYALISNSDAHSPQRLGREGNIFDTDLSYWGLFTALRQQRGFLGTVEFFPQEGKYHLDGHRKCGVCLHPEQTEQLKGICPACGKRLTVGVLHRVLELADRTCAQKPPTAAGYRYLIPLPELLAEVEGVGSSSQRVLGRYAAVVSAFGSELAFLLGAPTEDIQLRFGTLLAEAIRRMRHGTIRPKAGFDGEFGRIRVFADGELEVLKGQASLFDFVLPGCRSRPRSQSLEQYNPEAWEPDTQPPSPYALNDCQQQVLEAQEGATLVIAGPGTGKTRTLTAWLAHLVKQGIAAPQTLLGITFTNKAAAEMKERLVLLLGTSAREVRITTFHAFCLGILTDQSPEPNVLYGDVARTNMLRIIYPRMKNSDVRRLSLRIRAYLENPTLADDPDLTERAEAYRGMLQQLNALDVSGLVSGAVSLLEANPDLGSVIRDQYRYLALDEFQDIDPTQYQLLRVLLAPQITGAVLAIGDPDQAIYGFRGSDNGLFFRFRDEYGARTIPLAENYRCSDYICRAAHSVICRNQITSRVKLTTRKADGEPVTVFAARDPREEAKFIAYTIEGLVGGMDQITAGQQTDRHTGQYGFGDIALLCRTRALGDAFVAALARQGVPLARADNSSLFSRPPLSHAASLLALLVNPGDLASLLDLLTSPLCGLNEGVTRVALEECSRLAGEPLTVVEHMRLGETANQRSQIAAVFDLIARLKEEVETLTIASLLATIFDSLAAFREPAPRQALEQSMLLEAAQRLGQDIRGFLQAVALNNRESEWAPQVDRVRLLTFHAAKGLEFPVVFITCAEEGITPLLGGTIDLEEERRLFYVALTRAQDRVYISYAARRQHSGVTRPARSRFLGEMDPGTLAHAEPFTAPLKARQLELFS